MAYEPARCLHSFWAVGNPERSVTAGDPAGATTSEILARQCANCLLRKSSSSANGQKGTG